MIPERLTGICEAESFGGGCEGFSVEHGIRGIEALCEHLLDCRRRAEMGFVIFLANLEPLSHTVFGQVEGLAFEGLR